MTKLPQTLKTIILATLISFGLSYVYAWTAPTTTPPGGNVSAPINTGNNTQYKAGNLVLNDSTTPFVNGLIVRYGNVGIGTANPSTKLDVAGTIKTTGLQFSPTTAGIGKVLTSDASGNASWGATPQTRVTGSCAVGQAITAINADGTVSCVAVAGVGGIQTFTSTGNFIVPSNVTSVAVKVQGAGGGGGGGYSAGGGGGGGYAVGTFAVVAGSQYSVTIGSGGAGGMSSNAFSTSGSAGTMTMFGSLVSCTGGSGGRFSSSNPLGGSGGTCSGGSTNTTGGGGKNADAWNTAGTSGKGGNGGNSGGGVGAGTGGAGATYTVDATSGTSYGGGGGGSYANKTSGSGAQGRIIVEW